ncbi:exported hypothetical protein [uncultured Dysgonomonas sp.]|uniref:Outer membrane protein beta-barrel domain-containing protein n=2 Tax=root TaxID=1 RepID=A0A212J948_9BACT|nr:outer membrane beta-barrel protein [uncultured Dysgonomonas sp.]SBV95967.1 exported hypothetical protein [uncultured Dysgonomonas sp.]
MMKKYRYLVILITFLLFGLNINAQASKQSLSSKLYFLFDIGYLNSPKNNLKPGTIVKMAAEYRLDRAQGLYFRLNYDNRSNSYTNPEIQETNIVKGKIKFNDFLGGLGYRIRGNYKFRQFALLQSGISACQYQNIETADMNFIVNDQKKTIPIVKLTVGAEYYIYKSAALTFETGYIWHLVDTPFGQNHMNEGALSFSIGLTTTLF